jgi:hypothetical protein
MLKVQVVEKQSENRMNIAANEGRVQRFQRLNVVLVIHRCTALSQKHSI